MHVREIVGELFVDREAGHFVEELKHLAGGVDGPNRQRGLVARELHEVHFQGALVGLHHFDDPLLVRRQPPVLIDIPASTRMAC
jgi:hypothetical protein